MGFEGSDVRDTMVSSMTAVGFELQVIITAFTMSVCVKMDTNLLMLCDLDLLF